MPTVSASWKASLPIRWVGTWPVSRRSGSSPQRVGQAGHRIGGAGSGGDQHAAHLAGRARIAFRRVHRALLVPHQDVLHLVLREEGVIDRQHRAARIAEDVLHALISERRHHHFGAGHFACHGRHPCLLVPRSSRAIKKARKGPCPDASLESPCQGDPGCVRTFTTITILRAIGSARTFIARLYNPAPGDRSRSFLRQRD